MIAIIVVIIVIMLMLILILVIIIISFFQLQGTYNDHLVKLPDHFNVGQKLKNFIKGIVQIPLKH